MKFPFRQALLSGPLLLACVLAPPAHAADEALPVWETGPGLALLTYPDYRGASHYNFKPLPIPYFIYRGDLLKVTREGLKAQLIESDRLELSLSAAFALPGNSDDNPDSPRAGMPKLLPTFEIGPSLDWWLRAPQAGDWNWRLRLPVRAVAATDVFNQIDQAGWLVHPLAQADRRFRTGEWTWHLQFGAGPLFANHKYHAYFYEVKPQYATPTRAAYDPDGGYSGTRFTAYMGVGHGRWKLGVGILDDVLAGAAFVDSPLVQTKNAAVIGLGVTWQLWQSEARVGAERKPE